MRRPALPSSSDIGTQEDVRRGLVALLTAGPPPPAHVTAKRVQALRFDLRTKTLLHSSCLTAHTAIVLFGSSKFLDATSFLMTPAP